MTALILVLFNLRKALFKRWCFIITDIKRDAIIITIIIIIF